MAVNQVIDGLSGAQRELLVSHVDGAVPIVRDGLIRLQTLRKMVSIGLLSYDPPSRSTRPQRTILTEAGREALACLLGRYADALVRAGCLDDQVTPEERPLQILRRLREAALAGAAEQTALRSRNL